MRVIESNAHQSYIMGKKKLRLKHKSNDNNDVSDSSDEAIAAEAQPGTGTSCSHISKSINLGAVKKVLKQGAALGECQSCNKDNGLGAGRDTIIESIPNEEVEHLNSLDATVWLCLQCGNQGCDRNSKEQHALKHFQTPRSVSHCVVVNTTSWIVWCYLCDDEVVVECNKKLMECIDFVRRQAGFAKIDSIPTCKNVNLPSCQESNSTPDVIDDKSKLNKTKPIPAVGLQKVKGLSNLGNTCFFNAVMQSLSQTRCLETILVEKSKKGVVITLPGIGGSESETESVDSDNNDKRKFRLKPLDIALPEGGALSFSVLAFLQDMHASSKHSTLSPGSLFGQVCKKAPRFKGFQQQDSHELLRHLLDGMRAEEIKRLKCGILKAFHLPESVNPKNVDEETKTIIKEYGHQASHTFVESVFGGQLISTVLCEDCSMASQIFEPFLDLSLPITEEKPVRPNLLSKISKKNSEDLEEPLVTRFSDKEDDKPSKYQVRKMKRQAKKEAKTQKKRQGAKNKVVPMNIITNCEPHDKNSSMEEKWELEKSADDSSGREEEISDADVEDNTESDVSRLASVEQLDDSQDNSEDKMDPCKDTSDPETPDSLTIITELDSLCIQVGNLKIQNGPDSPNSEKDSQDILENCENLEVSRKSTELKIKYAHTIIDSNKMACDQKDLDEKLETTSRNRSKLDQDMIMKSRNSLASRYQASSHECSVQYCLNQFTAPELLTGNNKFGCENCTKVKEAKLGSRAVGGKKCEKVYTNASKQLLIFTPPAILTLHLKRFQQVGFNLRKVNRHVSFPLILDIAPFCSDLCQSISPSQKKVLYSLYSVVEHSGRLSGGHYTAYVKVRPESGRILSFLQKTCFKPSLRKRTVDLNLSISNSPDRHENISQDESTNEPLPGKWYHISDSHVTEVSESSVLHCQAYILFYERIL